MNHGLWAEIRRLRYVEGVSERDIADRFGISRGKVQRYLAKQAEQITQKRQYVSKLDSFKLAIDQILEKYPGLGNKRIFEKLRFENGYTGGKTIVGDYLLELRNHRKEAFVRYETAPGEKAQVDWGQ